MLKRLFCLLMALMLCPVIALADDQEAAALDWEELIQWTESYKTRAMTSELLNDPKDPAAYSEDGYAFMYEFGTLYMDRPEMTEDAVLKNLVITSHEEEAPHGTRVDYLTKEILAAYYNENENLAGDRGFASLYVSDMLPEGAAWGWVQRDGQRIMTIQYAVHEQLATGGDGYTDAGLVYTIQDNLVVAIRAYGLDVVVAEEDVRKNLNTVQELFDVNEYEQVPVSYIGTDLEAFNESDLTFAGVNFLELTPEKAVEAFGECRQEDWMQDDTGEYVCTMEFEKCEIVFVYDSNKQNPRVDMMAISMDGMEGPRAVRQGDTFSSVLNRFRYGENEYDGAREILYGDLNQASYGMAEYGTDASATLHYQTATSSGKDVMMYLYFEQMYLSEILIYVND